MRAQGEGVPRWRRVRWIVERVLGGRVFGGLVLKKGEGRWWRWREEKEGVVCGEGFVGSAVGFGAESSLSGAGAVGAAVLAACSSLVSGAGGPRNRRSQSHAHPFPTSPFLPSPRSTASQLTLFPFGLFSQLRFLLSR